MNYIEDLNLVLLQMELDRAQLELDTLEIDAPDSDEWWNSRERRDSLIFEIQNLYLN